MTKETLIRNYRKYNAADRYILGFTYKHDLYMVEVAEIMPRYLTIEKASTKNGGGYSLRLRLTIDNKKELLNHGAEKIGHETELADSKYNKGETFERIVTKRMGQTWTKDNKPFYKGGDIKTKDHSYQVKLENATITTESAIKKARQERKRSCLTKRGKEK